ncbi:MAG: hypothetical protein KDA88_14230 [Planctomycetaceae bacterium]|nr:hypothetical protein [Planctomycetaceae bacterium]
MQQIRRFVAVAILVLVSEFTQGQLFADQKLPEGLFIQGYAGRLSYVPDEEVTLHLNSSGGQCSLTVERVGAERQRVFAQDNIAVATHPIPDRASSHGCGWPEAFRFTIPNDWTSGYYEVKLSVSNSGDAAAGKEANKTASSLFFVVRRHQSSQAKILLQLSTNTYNAYTNWGGHSLYSYHDRDGVQGHRVSFERPLSSQFYNWEHPFVVWAEKNGYELDYAVNADLEFHPEILKQYPLVLSVGHDEYWSSPMRDNLEKYIAEGGNVAFFSGNTCCWQVRSEDDGKALTSYKQWYNIDPQYRTTDHRLLATLWGHHLVQRPENELTGVGFLWGGYHKSHGQFMDGPGSYEVHRADHWIFAGTGLKRGDRVGGEETVVGYECDGCEIEWRDGLPFPTCKDGTPQSFTILGTCPAKWHPGDCYWYDQFPTDRVGNSVMGMYEQGGTVFTAGSTDWAHGLRGKSPAIERITRNILDRLSRSE